MRKFAKIATLLFAAVIFMSSFLTSVSADMGETVDGNYAYFDIEN